MPSLRRISSSPNVRSSPYSSLTRSSHPFRRSPPGSDTSRRRVLADIDWWSVMDGQSTHSIPVYTTTSINDNNENHLYIPPPHASRPEDDHLDFLAIPTAEPPTRPATPSDSPVNTSVPTITLASPLAQFATLSLAPRAIPLNFRRHTFPGSALAPASSIYADDPFSSADSSPDLPSIPLTPPPLQSPSFIMSFADECTPAFHQNNLTPPRLSLGSPCKLSSWSSSDDDDFPNSIFGYHRAFDSLRPLVEDDFH